MHKLKVRANHTVYIIFAVLSLFSLTLIFNDNIWFDEAYTLSLIQHNYSDIINILKSSKIKYHIVASPSPNQCNYNYKACCPCILEPIYWHNHKKALQQ